MSLYVNLYGAPGAGKSTTRAGVFYRLKLGGYNVEEVPEVAKDLTWEERKFALGVQPYVFGKQLKNMLRVANKVDVVITDSPVLLAGFYADQYPNGSAPVDFRQVVRDAQAALKPNLNYYIQRVKKYNPAGRNQTVKQSDDLGDALIRYLNAAAVDFTMLPGTESAVGTIVFAIAETLSRMGIRPNEY